MVLHKNLDRMSYTIGVCMVGQSICLALAYVQGHAAGTWYRMLVNLTNG